MAVNVEMLKDRLSKFDIKGVLVEELGWDRYQTPPLRIPIEGETYSLEAIAEKRGLAVYVCQPDSEGAIPAYPIRRKIEKQASKSAYEHMIVFIDADQTEQIWQWVKRQAGTSPACREHHYRLSQTGEALIQKLQGLEFELNEEEDLNIALVAGRVQKSMDVEKVTKKFYDRFKKEHQTFLDFIEGIQAKVDREWYASLMLNRMMFIYFIQKKRFLDGDLNYLRNRLEMVQANAGPGRFQNFYRLFLLRLFHEGLGQPEAERSPEMAELIGRVPYLNGGLFDVHDLEKDHQINIPDDAFKQLFDFFDAYTWHLDQRPLRADNEINPDVLGYIFEKYINQKQMGAYYTKEDITGYISRNTIIPFLFDQAQKACPIAFQPEGGVWGLLKDDPDRYIYDAVRHGVDLDLPEEIEAGLDDVSKRGQWNTPAPEEYALPTEIWREHISRRKRCHELRTKLKVGEITSVQDLVTYNLDICKFAEDVIIKSEGPELVKAFWQAISNISVLDPTCGSGAFLFAALNVLEPLYSACLEGMQGFINDLERREKKPHPNKLKIFRDVLNQLAKHPSRRYFILKSIIIGNLYGVDIMVEAVEICKLRLFLKLVSQIDTVDQIEPLPDMDFNIRSGNTLVGFTSLDAVKDAMTFDTDGQQRMLYPEEAAALKQIEEEAEAADSAFTMFRKMQIEYDMDAKQFSGAKLELRNRLNSLRDELDKYLAGEYSVEPEDEKEFNKWRNSHQPFHWFVEFYGIMKSGGFDAIIGNPPYIELTKIKEYRFHGYSCHSCGNMYALVLERCDSIGFTNGYQGFIVPVSSISTDRYIDLQHLLSKREDVFCSFDDRPSRLFDGLEHIRLTIHLLGRYFESPRIFSTRYNKWIAEERDTLFNKLFFSQSRQAIIGNSIPKLCTNIEQNIIKKMESQERLLNHFYSRTGLYPCYYSRKVGYFLQILDFEPRVLNGLGERRPPSEFKELKFTSIEYAKLALCCLNANLFYWFITVFSDCRHVNKREVDAFPINLEALGNTDLGLQLIELSARLMDDFLIHSEHKRMKFAHDTLTIQCIFPKESKEIIDEIDKILAKHYGFTDEELDFIINYDVKYRMGING